MILPEGEQVVEQSQIHHREKEKILNIIDSITNHFNLRRTDFKQVIATRVDERSLLSYTLQLKRNSEYFLRWKTTGSHLYFTQHPHSSYSKPYTYSIQLNNYGTDPSQAIARVGVQWINEIEKKERIDKEFNTSYDGKEEFYADIKFDGFSPQIIQQYDRSITSEEKTDFKRMLLAWNDGVQIDPELDEEAKSSAEMVHELLQNELKTCNSFLEFMIRTDNTIKGYITRFDAKPLYTYVQSSGLAFTFLSAVFTAWSAMATGGGINGVTISLINLVGLALIEKEFKPKEI